MRPTSSDMHFVKSVYQCIRSLSSSKVNLLNMTRCKIHETHHAGLTKNSVSPPNPSPDDVLAPVVTDASARNRLVINLLLVATFVVILNETLMAVAIPRLMHDLQVTADAVQWLTTAFLLTMWVIIPVTGFLLQRINTRPIFILAMSLFSFGTLIAIVAPNLQALVVARIIQASGTAIMMPLLMTTAMTLAPAETRGKTMGYITTVISVAPAIGPTLSGVILNYLSWRWMFALVLPISLGALVLGARRMQNVTTPHSAALDGLSVVLSAFAFGGIVYGLSSIGVAAAPGSVPAGIWIA